MARKICRVLVVEDDSQIQQLLGDTFADEGYRFALAGTADEMRRVLDTGDVDVVIIDVMLPGRKTGLQLAEEVTALGYGVVLVTGHPSHFEAVEKSGHAFLHKPFRLPSLLQLVDKVLRDLRAKCHVKNQRYG